MKDIILKVKGLRKSYHDRKSEILALEDINLEVDRPITYYCYHCDLEELKDFF